MSFRLEELLKKFNELEKEILFEINQKEKEFFYEIKKKRVHFEKEIQDQHKTLVKKIRTYLKDAAILNILTAPFIWSCLFPALFMDLVLNLYQTVCFPVYGIPKVRRSDYVALDRHYLHYLNWIERMNCIYCGYFNGIIGFSREVAARTEQYWCPIKHARKNLTLHSRHKNFLDYGDAQGYRKKIEDVRRNFSDLK
jgi:hypothetical protein